MDTNLAWCEVCGYQYDRLIGTGKRNICEECEDEEFAKNVEIDNQVDAERGK